MALGEALVCGHQVCPEAFAMAAWCSGMISLRECRRSAAKKDPNHATISAHLNVKGRGYMALGELQTSTVRVS